MEVETTYLTSGKTVVGGSYTEVKTRDSLKFKEIEPIRNEIINVLAKYNLPYWKAKVILGNTKEFLVKEAVVQEIDLNKLKEGD